MKTNHTKKPWVLMPVSDTYKICTLDGEAFVAKHHYMAGEPFVAELNEDFRTDKSNEEGKQRGYYTPQRNPKRLLANARMLAAAPDMFDAIRDFLKANDDKGGEDIDGTIYPLRKALKLAIKGRTDSEVKDLRRLSKNRSRQIHPCECSCYNCINGAHDICDQKPRCKLGRSKQVGLMIVVKTAQKKSKKPAK